MQKNLSEQGIRYPRKVELPQTITFLIGTSDTIRNMPMVPAKALFAEDVIEFLDTVSKQLMTSKEAKKYPDVVTFGFWLRKASLKKLKERFEKRDGNLHMGRGIVFHIAPSNVPVNYAYSLVSGLLTGNANVVRIPSKKFPQVTIINEAIQKALDQQEHMKPYIALVQYEREQKINDVLSTMADVRVIWGGDATIAEIRKSELAPRAGEITFADRYSLAVIDSEEYLKIGNKGKVAEDFYNDTFLTDQNACTSPRIVIWTGGAREAREAAKEEFWSKLHDLVKKKYPFQPIQGVNKLTSSYLIAVAFEGSRIMPREDNLIVRVKVSELSAKLMDLKDNSGYFFEYDCDDLTELFELCNDKRCQTIGYIGKKAMFSDLLAAAPRGIDRIVPIGKTMDFELLWDGYDLTERMSRTVRIQ